MRQIMRGDVIYVDLGQHPNSSIQSGIRPCVVISNNQNNKYSKVISVCPCTGRVTKKKVITHILVTTKDVNGYFQKNSILLIEQITVVEKKQIISKVGHIPRDSEIMKKVNCLIKKQLGVD